MEIGISVVAKIVEFTVGPVIHQFRYLILYNRNMKDLKEKVENLEVFREAMRHRVDEAKRNAEDIEIEVQNWFNKVGTIMEEYQQFQEHDGEAKKFCFNQSCLNFVQRHRLSRRANKLAGNVLQVKEEGNFERISYRRDPQQFRSLIDAKSNYVSFESRNSIKENIMEALKDPSVYMIGVYGMGGVGKTKLAHEILRSVKETKLFEKVVMTTISQDPNMIKIQGEISERLGLRLEEETVQGRAFKLLKRLEDEKSILIVLDDMWKALDLETIGIPHERCKMLIISRDKHVLFNEMDVKVNFDLKILNDKESWSFFNQVIDVSIEENCDLERIAHQVVRECDGLPIALVTVAKALRGKPLAIWQDALDQLKNSNVVNIKGMNEKVYSSLELSYNFLEHDETKNLFLLCSIYPEDYEINVEKELLKYAMGMRLLIGVDTISKGRNRLVKLINDLKSSCLLLECGAKKDDYVKMHDVVRDFARWIVASKHKEMSSRIRNNNVKFVSYNDLENLINPYESSKLLVEELELLVVSCNLSAEWKRLQLPETFFNGMDKLKVLELKKMTNSKLPSSLYSLRNSIQSLSLWRCDNLENMDLIGGLKRLEILSLRESRIKELPLAISELTQLKVLDLSYCYSLERIRPNIISRLTNLEELDLKHSFNKWEPEENLFSQNANLSELKLLPHLATLRTQIRGHTLSEQITFLNGTTSLKLERFEIYVGDVFKNDDEDYGGMRMVKFEDLHSRIVFNNDLKWLVNNAEKIILKGSEGGNEVLSQLDITGFHFHPRLKHLKIFNDAVIRHLITETHHPNFLKALAALESLHLKNLQSLKSIIFCHKLAVCFRNLTIIQVVHCYKLRELLFFSAMKGLTSLQSIEIKYCPKMEGIVVMENHEETTTKLELHQLKSLVLMNSPEFTSFCFEPKSQHILELEERRNLNPLLNQQVEFNNLEVLIVRELQQLKFIWDDRLIGGSFNHLKKINIEGCKNLRKVFSCNMIRTCLALEQVKIRQCESLEELFEMNDPNLVEKYDHIVHIPLSHLQLYDLLNLTQVWSKDPKNVHLTFQKLKIVEIKGCFKLESLFPASFTKYLQQLEVLSISRCKFERIFEEEEGEEGNELLSRKATFPRLKVLSIEYGVNVKSIWHDELIVDSFCSLQSVSISGCPMLKKVFPCSIMREIKGLKRLEIQFCRLLEEIFEIDDEAKKKRRFDVLDSQLIGLKLNDLPNLKHVWSKDPQQTITFQNLQDVRVSECSMLKTLFPASFEEYIPHQLQNLIVKSSRLEQIFGKQGTLDKDLVSNKVLFYNLQELRLLFGEKIQSLKLDKSSRNLTKTLELVGVSGYKWTHLPSEFDQIFPKFEKIKVKNMFLMEIFCTNQRWTDAQAPLKELHLKFLPKLIHIWKGGSEMNPLFQNLEILSVMRCRGLNMLLPLSSSSSTLRNLKTLEIIRCHGMTDLLSCSMAKSLVQLENMIVEDCKKMSTIFVEEDDKEEEGKVVFRKLKSLKLFQLPRVKAFYLGKSTLQFPCLELLKVSKCLEMEMFSLGIVNMPQLKYLSLIPSLGPSPVNINAIIRKCWEDDKICENLFEEKMQQTHSPDCFSERKFSYGYSQGRHPLRMIKYRWSLADDDE